MTVQRLVADISKDDEAQLTEIFNKCVYYSLTVDETTDIVSSTQMCVLARGVTYDSKVFEQPVELQSMQAQTKGSDFFQTLVCSLHKHHSELSKLEGIATDRTPSMISSK
jgi:hypothetical protein